MNRDNNFEIDEDKDNNVGLDFSEFDNSLESAQQRIVEKFRQDNLINDEINNALLDPKKDSFIEIIKDNVNFCVDELRQVEEAMQKINNQRNSEMFFRKSENIKLLSQYMSKVASVNQKTIDLIILLLGANGKISDEYENIIDTIEELGKLNNGEAEVLNYLVKVKRMINEIHDNDSRLKQVLEDNTKTREIVDHADESFKKEVEESEKSRKLVESKCNRLAKRIALNNLYITICLLLLIGLGIFIGVKFYVH